MHLVEFISFDFLPFILRGESLQNSSSEITKILILWRSYPGLNIIDGKMNIFSSKIFRGEVDIQVGKVALYSYARYGSY